jgi:HK97 family phage major capsid protein
MPTATALTADYVAKHQQLSDFFGKYKSADLTPEQVEQVRSWNVELNDIGAKREKAIEVEGIESKTREIGTELAKPVGRPSFGGTELAKADTRGFGDVVCAALFNKEGKYKGKTEAEVPGYGFAEFKTTMTTSGAFPPEARRSGRLDLSLQAPIMLTDMLPTIPVSMGTYTYMRETTFTNAAAGIAEAATYPESALAYTPVTATVTKIGTFIPVTEEQISDVDGMRALIDNRLTLMVKLEIEDEILNSTGTSNELNGFYNQVTQTYALAGDDLVFDAILKGMNKVRTIGMANPDMVVLHPNDFIDIRLARTGDGIYIMGNPDQVGLDRLFGVRTVQSLKATENTALVGDFSTHSALLTRWGLEVMSSNSDGTDFVKDIIKVKARVRLGLAIFRILAFCEVTGI